MIWESLKTPIYWVPTVCQESQMGILFLVAELFTRICVFHLELNINRIWRWKVNLFLCLLILHPPLHSIVPSSCAKVLRMPWNQLCILILYYGSINCFSSLQCVLISLDNAPSLLFEETQCGLQWFLLFWCGRLDDGPDLSLALRFFSFLFFFVCRHIPIF